MIFPEDIAKDYYGFMLPKDSELTSKINSALSSLGSSFMSSLETKWINATSETRIDLDSYAVIEPTGTIKYSFAAGNEPFSYLIEEEASEDETPSIGGDDGSGIIPLREDSQTTTEDVDEGSSSSSTDAETITYVMGYEVELMYAVAQKLNMELEVTCVPEFRDTFTEIDSGSADVVSGGISITDERKLTYDFSSAIFEGAISIAIRSETYAG